MVAANSTRSARGAKKRDSSELRPMFRLSRTASMASSRFGERGRPRIDGREHVDQHDLAIDPLEVVAEEGRHDLRLVGLEPPLHQPREAVRVDRVGRRSRGAKVSAGEPARSPGIRKRPGGVVATDSGRPRSAVRYALNASLARSAATSSQGEAGSNPCKAVSQGAAISARPGRRVPAMVERDHET